MPRSLPATVLTEAVARVRLGFERGVGRYVIERVLEQVVERGGSLVRPLSPRSDSEAELCEKPTKCSERNDHRRGAVPEEP